MSLPVVSLGLDAFLISRGTIAFHLVAWRLTRRPCSPAGRLRPRAEQAASLAARRALLGAGAAVSHPRLRLELEGAPQTEPRRLPPAPARASSSGAGSGGIATYQQRPAGSLAVLRGCPSPCFSVPTLSPSRLCVVGTLKPQRWKSRAVTSTAGTAGLETCSRPRLTGPRLTGPRLELQGLRGALDTVCV